MMLFPLCLCLEQPNPKCSRHLVPRHYHSLSPVGHCSLNLFVVFFLCSTMPLTLNWVALTIRLVKVPDTSLDHLVTTADAPYSCTVKPVRHRSKPALPSFGTQTGGSERLVEAPFTANAFAGPGCLSFGILLITVVYVYSRIQCLL